MELSEYDISHRIDAELLANHRLTPVGSQDDVRELTLRVNDKHFSYKAGQSIAVLVPGPHDFGNPFHVRLYTIADAPPKQPSELSTIHICVKRCDYIDEYSGERYQGVASNYLCDCRVGQHVEIAGPYGLPFAIPDQHDANLLLIGMGTGIAPFRAMVKTIYENYADWSGKIRLFYGARTGLETLYMNDERDDFANYYDRETFVAFKALSPRPDWDTDASLGDSIKQQGEEIWSMLCDYRTYVYLAGLTRVRESLEQAFVHIAGSEEKWLQRKAELVAGKRWSELIY